MNWNRNMKFTTISTLSLIKEKILISGIFLEKGNTKKVYPYTYNFSFNKDLEVIEKSAEKIMIKGIPFYSYKDVQFIGTMGENYQRIELFQNR